VRQRIGSGAPWEAIVGYSRAVRAGSLVEVAGTTSVGPDGTVRAPGDPAEQTRIALATVREALAALGARIEDVVRSRLYVVDIGDWEAVGRAHGEVFGDVRPASTMVQVAALIDPAMLVEIEVTAVVPDG
jgi:enamine deaminase RidA (YjgF/YER057c/UK114 family)